MYGGVWSDPPAIVADHQNAEQERTADRRHGRRDGQYLNVVKPVYSNNSQLGVSV